MNTPAKTKSTAAWRRSAFGAAAVFSLLASVSVARAQGSRKDDTVLGPQGHPVSGATVRVCQPTAAGTPCAPLATIYTDATLTVTSANPFQTDGLGNYHFYAPAGRYEIQIFSPQINGTITQPDVILPADLSSSSAGNNISAFGLTLGGDLSVAGNTTINGTLSTSSFNPGSFAPASLNVSGNSTFAGPRPYIDVTSPQYGAIGDGGAEQASGTISAGSNQLTIVPGIGTWKVGMGLHVDGAGASGDVLLARITAISGNVFTLSANASTSVTSAGVQDDDTLAIQAAISAFCTGQTNANGGSIFFSPGNYIFSQPQAVNSSGVPFTACQGIHFEGGNSAQHNGTPFAQPPTSTLLAHCGPSPNAHAAFEANYPNGNVAFDNLVIAACNKAVYVGGAQVVKFRNTFLSVSPTGLTDNSALHISDTFWIYFDGGGLSSNSASVPTLLMTADTASGAYVGVGNVYMDGALLSNGPISYIQRGNLSGEPPGHWVIRNTTQESANTDLIQITNPGSYSFPSAGPITLDDVQQADNSNSTAALIDLNSASTTLSGVYINNSFAGGNGITSPAVKITAGSLDHYFITGCDAGCVSQVWNSSGNPAGSGATQSTAGFDYSSDTTNVERLNSSPLSNLNINGVGPVLRATQSGSQYASYGVDAANGFLLGSNTQAGWNAQIFQSTPPNIDIAFAANYPPTGVSATLSNTGGSLSTGTYYVYVVSTTGSNCSSASSFSAPSAIVGPFTVGSGVITASINLTWTAAATGLTAIQGYCAIADSRGEYSKFDPVSNLVSGASSTSATIGSFPNSPSPEPVTRQMVQVDHLTPNSAIFNTISLPALGIPPYTPACMTATTCTGFIPENPFAADSFARANASSLGPNWSQNYTSGAYLVISGNTATASTGGGYAVDSWNAQTFTSDQFSRATINTFTGGSSDLVLVAVRAQSGANTFYALQCLNGQEQLIKVVSGTTTTFAAISASCPATKTIEIDVVGSNPAYLTAIVDGSVVATYADSSSPLTGGAPGIGIWSSSDSLTNWTGGSLPPGNGGESIFSQPNTWTQPQTFAIPITSASLAIPNKTRTCNIVRGDQSGSVLTTGNIQPQGSLCYVDAASTVTQVVVMADAGASTVQLGYRHNGSTTAITSTLTPASVSGVTDHVACANAGGTAVTIEGNSVTCSTLSASALALGDYIETVGGAADGATKRLSIAVTLTVN